MSAVVEIELKELNDGGTSMFIKFYNKNATKVEFKAATNLINFISTGAVDSGAEEVFSQDLERPNPVTNGKN
ncbi:MAG: hypothetical protein EBR82_70465 [Caulobacteraceae bacterium]|jgi:hypothetical protein|nr:hypothetical protein [Caulobacteraceae bacterium]NDC49714.1 hypothetical protein [Micrococcales bacterium]